MAEAINVSIAQESVKQIIDAHVTAAVTEALNRDGARLIDALVRNVLNRKRENYSNSQTILQETIEAVIVEEVKKAMAQWVETQRPKIATAMEAHIKKNTSRLVGMLVDSTAKMLANYWNVNVTLNDRRG